VSEEVVLAKRQTSASSRISVRYYLWSADGPCRIPDGLHRDLIDRKVALPQYATSKQKVLEVFARRISATTYSLRGRGSIYSFDERGYLERDQAGELMGFVVEQARQKLKGGKVISIDPTLRERRFKREHYWEPTRSMLDLISVDFQKASRAMRRIKVLKRSS
jgi:hypothetical protein